MGYSYLSQRSEYNQKAAQQLVKGPLHSSSIHCSYYSCVQLMNHILLHKKRIDGRNFNPKNLEGRREGSHEALIGYFTKDLDELGADWESFYERIYDLKTFRTDCDYKDVAVMPQHSQKAFELSGQILDQLFEYYDL